MVGLHLVRHGEVYNPKGILYGRLPGFRLSQMGRRQALAAGDFLKDKAISAVFSSPLLRARQTAERILRHHDALTQRTSVLLHEVCTPYEGQPGQVIDARYGDVYSVDNAESESCYEQPADIVHRVNKFMARWLKKYTGDVVAVTHGDVIVFTLLQIYGFALTPANKNRLKEAGFAVPYPATASVTTLTFKTLSLNEPPQVSYVVPYS